MQTLSVRPTMAGDGKFFVTTKDEQGRVTVDSLPFSKLTDKQKDMSHALDVPGVKPCRPC